MAKVKLDDRVQVPEGVHTRVLGDELVILQLKSGKFFGLDPIGTRMWNLLMEGKSISEVKEQILQEYDATPDAVEKDLVELADLLVERELLKVK